jgi:hypothetical protein
MDNMLYASTICGKQPGYFWICVSNLRTEQLWDLNSPLKVMSSKHEEETLVWISFPFFVVKVLQMFVYS